MGAVVAEWVFHRMAPKNGKNLQKVCRSQDRVDMRG